MSKSISKSALIKLMNQLPAVPKPGQEVFVTEVPKQLIDILSKKYPRLAYEDRLSVELVLVKFQYDFAMGDWMLML